MHATFRHQQTTEPGRSIKGTHPSGPSAAASVATMLPRLLAIVVAMAVVRNVIMRAKRRHGGSSRWSGHREAIAAFHRELHAEEKAGDRSSESEGPSDEAIGP